MKMKALFRIVLVVAAIAGSSGYSTPVLAATETPHAPEQDWSFDGMFGTYDRGAMQRGMKVYQNVCAACHGMEHLRYRNLGALGYNENQIKNIAAQYMVTDGE